MKTTCQQNLLATALVCALAFKTIIAQAADPLPSWNDGKAKQSITEFVAKVTKTGSPDFVPVPERIATFDNDGTLWAEQPMYFQFYFAVDRVKALVLLLVLESPCFEDEDENEDEDEPGPHPLLIAPRGPFVQTWSLRADWP